MPISTLSTLPFVCSKPLMVNFFRPVHSILGLPVDILSLSTAQERIYTATNTRTPCFLSTPNLNFAAACLKDREFRNSVINSDLSIADGMPLVWIARLLGVPIKERVTGSGLFERLQQKPDKVISVYFFGGINGAAEKAEERINAHPSGLRCVGSHSPGFGSIEELSQEKLIENINKSRCDFLIIALGAKKGQAWIERNKSRLQVSVISHLGAVVNFAAGSIQRAPHWVQQTGLEWLWRIKEEPLLWRRYFDDGLAFLNLLATRVIPGAISRRRHLPTSDALLNARVVITGDENLRCIKPQGAWCESNLSHLRRSFEKVARLRVNVVVDLSKTSFVDSAFIGILMLLYGHQHRFGLVFNITQATPLIRRMFKYHCADFLLQADSTEKSEPLPQGESLPLQISDSVKI